MSLLLAVKGNNRRGGLPWWLSDLIKKIPLADAGDTSSIPGVGRFPGEGTGNPLQYSCLGNPVDKGCCGLSPWSCKRVRRLSD